MTAAGAPLAYEPPMIVPFTDVRVSATTWKSGSSGVSGKSTCGPTVWYGPPLTVTTAAVGIGAGGGFAAVPDVPEPPATEPEPDEPAVAGISGSPTGAALDDELDELASVPFAETCCVKGSLLSKRSNET